MKAIILLGKSIGKRIVAEGVETDKELECIRRLGCDEIQGYLYSKPLPVEKFLAFKQKYSTYDADTEEMQTQTSLKKLKTSAF